MYTAINHWNGLSKDIKAVTREHRFKGAIKNYLFDKMEQSDKSDFQNKQLLLLLRPHSVKNP